MTGIKDSNDWVSLAENLKFTTLKSAIGNQNGAKLINKIINNFVNSDFGSLLLLLGWLILGAALRFTNLDLKPASSIEIATVGYSLGHGFSSIPLDQILPLKTLLSPLSLDVTVGYGAIFERLITESTHPPLYFWLTNWWINLWVENGNLVSLQVARSLSALFGVLSIPAIFGLSWLSFRSRLTAHLAALLMAISPYGIYLAQEARHYTLTILWVIASLACLIKATQLIKDKLPLPGWLSASWIVVNILGVATHYFFVLALAAEAIALVVFWFYAGRGSNLEFKTKSNFKSWRGICLAALGTLAGCLVWLPFVMGVSGNELTSWIKTSYRLSEILLPLPRMFGWMATMIVLLPLEGVSQAIAICSVVIIGLVIIWTTFTLLGGLSRHFQAGKAQENIANSATLIFGGYLCGAILLFLGIIYGLGRDISLAARYHFVYFPVFILLIAFALTNSDKAAFPQTKQTTIAILILGLLGSLTVANNYGFQKSRFSDRLTAFIQTNSVNNAIVAMRHNTYSEVRELIGVAYSFNRLQSQNMHSNDESSSSPEYLSKSAPQFLLNRLYIDGKDMGLYNIDHALATQPKPLDLWAINLAVGEADMNRIHCFKNETVDLESVQSGYRDRLYRCESPPSS